MFDKTLINRHSVCIRMYLKEKKAGINSFLTEPQIHAIKQHTFPVLARTENITHALSGNGSLGAHSFVLYF